MAENICAYFGISTVSKTIGRIMLALAAANHTVLLNEDGVAYTFGRHTEGQLLRFNSNTVGWNAVPGAIAGNDQFKVELVLACENATLILYHRRLLSNDDLLSAVDASASSNYLLLSVAGKRGGTDRWIVDKRNSTVRCVRNAANQLVAFDPLQGVLWAYDHQLHEITVEIEK